MWPLFHALLHVARARQACYSLSAPEGNRNVEVRQSAEQGRDGAADVLPLMLVFPDAFETLL